MTGWFAPAQLADLALPGLPRTKRGVNELAGKLDWGLKTDAQGAPLARTRKGQGGGLEYHWSVLPPATRASLVKRGLVATNVVELPVENKRPDIWAWFEALPEKARTEAKRRLAVLDAVARLERSGATATAAIASVSASHDVGMATIHNWRRDVRGIDPNSWLPHLAPRYVGGGIEAEIDPECWLIFKSDQLRPEKPCVAQTYRAVQRHATANGIAIPHVRTFMRKFEREVDPMFALLKREGAKALEAGTPALTRDVRHLHAMEWVNIDGHLADIYVHVVGPDGVAGDPFRPMIVMSQDIFSSKLLTWSVGEAEDINSTRAMFVQMFKKYGIPRHCLMDNSRAFASKELTEGTVTRYRGSVRPGDRPGMLVALGIQCHFATPFHGQAKPIERAFRDLASAFKDPRLAGAYTGNSTRNKPSNHGEKSIPIDVFATVLADLVAEHNSRIGRRGRGKLGRSFDQIFAESYAVSEIGKASPAQLRLAMLTAHKPITAHRNNGAVTIFGNTYWTDASREIAGERIVVRYDPDDLHSEVHLYAASDDRFLLTVPVFQPAGFDSAVAAKRQGKLRGDLRKAMRNVDAKERLLTAAQIAAILPDSEEPELPEPTVVRMLRQRGSAALKQVSEVALRPDEPSTMEQIGFLKLVE